MLEFDPYTVWLDIPLQEQPPHYYRLLGIGLYENDAAVIEAAADRQMACIKTPAADEHVELAQKLLDEISAASVCLLNAEKKADYDRELKTQLADGVGARIYRYRPHIIRLRQLITSLCFAGSCLLLLLLVGVAYAWPISTVTARVAGIFMIGVPLAFMVIWAILWRESYGLTGASIELDDEALVYRSWRGVLRLPFDRMLPLRFPSNSGLRISTEDFSVRIIDVLKGIGEFVRELKTRLDTQGMSDRYDAAQIFRFLKTAEGTDQNWERLYENFWKLALLVVTAGGLGVLFALVQRCDAPDTVNWVITSQLWPIISCYACKVVFGRRIARLADQEHFTCPPRDRAWERMVYRKAFRRGLCAYLAVSLAIVAYSLMT